MLCLFKAFTSSSTSAAAATTPGAATGDGSGDSKTEEDVSVSAATTTMSSSSPPSHLFDTPPPSAGGDDKEGVSPSSTGIPSPMQEGEDEDEEKQAGGDTKEGDKEERLSLADGLKDFLAAREKSASGEEEEEEEDAASSASSSFSAATGKWVIAVSFCNMRQNIVDLKRKKSRWKRRGRPPAEEKRAAKRARPNSFEESCAEELEEMPEAKVARMEKGRGTDKIPSETRGEEEEVGCDKVCSGLFESDGIISTEDEATLASQGGTQEEDDEDECNNKPSSPSSKSPVLKPISKTSFYGTAAKEEAPTATKEPPSGEHDDEGSSPPLRPLPPSKRSTRTPSTESLAKEVDIKDLEFSIGRDDENDVEEEEEEEEEGEKENACFLFGANRGGGRPLSTDALESPQERFVPPRGKGESEEQTDNMASSSTSAARLVLGMDAECEDEIASCTAFGDEDDPDVLLSSSRSSSTMAVLSEEASYRCSISLTDVFDAASPLGSFLCSGCSRPYSSRDLFTVDLKGQTLSVTCDDCRWWAVRRVKLSPSLTEDLLLHKRKRQPSVSSSGESFSSSPSHSPSPPPTSYSPTHSQLAFSSSMPNQQAAI